MYGKPDKKKILKTQVLKAILQQVEDLRSAETTAIYVLEMVRKRSGFGRGFFPQLRSSKFKTRQTKGIVKLSVGPNYKVQFLKKILALIKNGISASQNFFGKPTYWLISRKIMNFSFDFDSFQFAKIFEIFPGKIKELTDFHPNTYRNFDSHHFHVYNMFFCCLKIKPAYNY